MLKDIVNKRFKHKSIEVTKEGIKVIDEDNGKDISLNSLSSGEQHELYLFSKLIFDEPPDILFIDEPEISLHVGWQNVFIDDLLKISKLTKRTQIMIATHSPTILGNLINDAFDLGVMSL